MSHPEDYLSACKCANWQEAQRLIATGHPDEAILFAAWHSAAMLAPPIEVHELFNTGQAPERPYLIWQNRYDKAALLANRKRVEEEALDLHLYTIEDMLAALQDPTQPLPRRLAAAHGLGDHKHRPAVLPLIEAMNTEDHHLAFACSNALNAIESCRHRRRLLRYLRPNAPDAAKQAAIYCLSFRDRRGANSLARITLDRARESDDSRLMAAEALRNHAHKPFIQRVLAQALDDPCVGVRLSVLCALQVIELTPSLRRSLEAHLNDTEVIYGHPFAAHVRFRLDGLGAYISE